MSVPKTVLETVEEDVDGEGTTATNTSSAVQSTHNPSNTGDEVNKLQIYSNGKETSPQWETSDTITSIDVYITTPAEASEKTTNPPHKVNEGVTAELNADTEELSRCITWAQSKVPSSAVQDIPKTKHHKSVNNSMKLSKVQLEYYLPRRNFFNSHDKVLREAGFDVDDNDKSRKKPDWKKIYRLPSYVASENALEDTKTQKSESGSKSSEIKELVDQPPVPDITIPSPRRQPRPKQRDKKIPDESYKPLLDYLRYISENPTEYLQLTKYSSRNMDHVHPSNMVRMARAFKKWHHGTLRENIFIHALGILKPKLTDTPLTRVTKEKNARKESSQKLETTLEQGTSADEGKTELEKLKVKAEKWMKGLSTMEWLKAKEVALMEMGQEDINYSRWWVAFQNCSYLRQPHSTVDATMKQPTPVQ